MQDPREGRSHSLPLISLLSHPSSLSRVEVRNIRPRVSQKPNEAFPLPAIRSQFIRTLTRSRFGKARSLSNEPQLGNISHCKVSFLHCSPCVLSIRPSHPKSLPGCSHLVGSHHLPSTKHHKNSDRHLLAPPSPSLLERCATSAVESRDPIVAIAFRARHHVASPFLRRIPSTLVSVSSALVVVG